MYSYILMYSGDRRNLIDSPEEMEVDHTNNSKYKKFKSEKNFGTNIVNKMENHQEFGENFVKFYFDNILKQKDYTMFRSFTEFKYKKHIYTNEELIKLIEQMGEADTTIFNIEVIPSGSRRFDIQVLGTIGGNTFSQYFLINNEKRNNWSIKTSIISTL